MPTNTPQQPGLLGGIWNNMRDRARARFNETRQGVRNATPGQPGFDPRQAIDFITEPFFPGNVYASQNAPGDRWAWQRAGNNMREGWNSFLGGFRGSAPLPGDPAHGPMPNYGNPNAPQPAGLPTLPTWGTGNTHAGPPAPIAAYGNGAGMFPMQGQPGRQGTAGRFGTTIATGQNAVNMARSFARTGLGASSFGRDQMNRQQREG